MTATEAEESELPRRGLVKCVDDKVEINRQTANVLQVTTKCSTGLMPNYLCNGIGYES